MADSFTGTKKTLHGNMKADTGEFLSDGTKKWAHRPATEEDITRRKRVMKCLAEKETERKYHNTFGTL